MVEQFQASMDLCSLLLPYFFKIWIHDQKVGVDFSVDNSDCSKKKKPIIE